MILKTSLLLAVALLSCGKGSDKTGAKGGAPAVSIDVAGVNALVPAELKAKLVFDKTDVVEEMGHHLRTYTLAAPKGWASKMKGFASLKGPDDMGFFTSLDLGNNCDGTCEPKDWAATSDKALFSQFAKDKVVKDEKKPNSRLLISERDTTTFVVYAWWANGAKRYHSCFATLEKQVSAAAPAFEKACQAVTVSGDD
ncbi:hypothetical protein BH11MYX1_BH11MYX1_29770 [soil metagenome]